MTMHARTQGLLARSKLHTHTHNPGCTAQLAHSVPPNSTGGDGELDIAIAFLGRTRWNKLYLFDIANSPGHIEEQVRGDIEDWLKF